MKIIATSDWHGDAKTLGHARFVDVDRAVRQVVQEAIRWEANMFCFLGDLCDPDAGSAVFRCVQRAISAARELSEARIPSWWLAGNHDVIEDGSGETVLNPLKALRDPRVSVLDRPGSEDFGEVRFVALPFTASSHAYAPRAEAQDAVGNYRRLVVLSHLAVEGIQPGEETTDMPRGREVLFPHDLFHDGVKDTLLLQGHYHRAHTFEAPGLLPVHVVGAPCRFTFANENDTPSFLKIEV